MPWPTCPGSLAWDASQPLPSLLSSSASGSPPLPYSACCSQGAAQTLGVMKKLPRDQSFPWDHLHFDFTITDGELQSVKNFQDLKRVSRQELLHVCDCQHEAWSHRDTCWYKARKHTHTQTCTHTHKRLLKMLPMRNVRSVTFYVSIQQESYNSTNQIILLPTEMNVANISFFHVKGTPFNVFILEAELS